MTSTGSLYVWKWMDPCSCFFQRGGCVASCNLKAYLSDSMSMGTEVCTINEVEALPAGRQKQTEPVNGPALPRPLQQANMRPTVLTVHGVCSRCLPPFY